MSKLHKQGFRSIQKNKRITVLRTGGLAGGEKQPQEGDAEKICQIEFQFCSELEAGFWAVGFKVAILVFYGIL